MVALLLCALGLPAQTSATIPDAASLGQRASEVVRAEQLVRDFATDLDRAVSGLPPNAALADLQALRDRLPDATALRARADRVRAERTALRAATGGNAELRDGRARCAGALGRLATALDQLATRARRDAALLGARLAAARPAPPDARQVVALVATGWLAAALLLVLVLAGLRRFGRRWRPAPEAAAEVPPPEPAPVRTGPAEVARESDAAIDAEELRILTGGDEPAATPESAPPSRRLLHIPVQVPAELGPAQAGIHLVQAARGSTLVCDEPTPSLHARPTGPGYELHLRTRDDTRPEIVVAQLRAALRRAGATIRIGTPTTHRRPEPSPRERLPAAGERGETTPQKTTPQKTTPQKTAPERSRRAETQHSEAQQPVSHAVKPANGEAR